MVATYPVQERMSSGGTPCQRREVLGQKRNIFTERNAIYSMKVDNAKVELSFVFSSFLM